MSESRTSHAKRNIITGLLNRIVNLILPFIIRTIIIFSLGEQYQGISSLFTSILSVLNLTELGFSTAVVYILYKPVAEKDNEFICAIMNYLKKIYRTIGLVMLMIGIIIMPFLPMLIKGTYPPDINLYILYLIYLINAVVSYWMFAYKSALLTAEQRSDIINNIATITQVAMRIAQIIVLLIFKNYYIFAIFMPLASIVNNLLIQFRSNKIFPLIIANGEIPDLRKKELIKQVKGIMINRIGDVARNGADSIFISAFIGLVAVAAYDNYYYIYTAIYGISLVIVNSVNASVGNSIATESKEKNYKDLSKFTFLFSLLMGWCTVCLVCLYQPFMQIWMHGKSDLILSNLNMLLFCVYFYAITMNNTRNMYINGTGIFWELRKTYLFEAAGNIILNYVLAYFFGITGILLATIITIVIFNFISRTNILFHTYFEISPIKFYVEHLLYIFVTLLNGSICYFICCQISIEGIIGLSLKTLVCIIVSPLIYYLAYFKTEKFKHGVKFVKSLIFNN